MCGLQEKGGGVCVLQENLPRRIEARGLNSWKCLRVDGTLALAIYGPSGNSTTKCSGSL